MKIAVPFDNGNVWQHFGHTEFFKIYEVENNRIVSSEVIDSKGSGHGALAGMLADLGINAVICGGLGEGALQALREANIEVCAGASGDADEAVAAWLRGELKDTGANCDHHEHGEEHSCGGCGGGCGGCGGDCGSVTPVLEGPNAGKIVKVHYKGTFNDGTQFDSSFDRGEPLEFICGAGMMIPGFDKAVVDMEVGQVVDIHLSPEEAYGQPDPRAVFTVPLAQLEGAADLSVGEQVYLQGSNGAPFMVRVTAKDDETITLDANHEMAGKELNFQIELVEIK